MVFPIRVVGSQANGKRHEGSDWDLQLETPYHLNDNNRFEMFNQMEQDVREAGIFMQDLVGEAIETDWWVFFHDEGRPLAAHVVEGKIVEIGFQRHFNASYCI